MVGFEEEKGLQRGFKAVESTFKASVFSTGTDLCKLGFNYNSEILPGDWRLNIVVGILRKCVPSETEAFPGGKLFGSHQP